MDGQMTNGSAGIGVVGQAKPLTFGEKCVDIMFNPGGNEKVFKVKRLYADIIDLLTDGDLDNGASGLKGRILGRAINDAIVAQMLAVKFITLPDEENACPF